MYKYEHGGDIYRAGLASTGKRIVDFSANINPLGLPASVKQAVKDALKLCKDYPDPFCHKLTAATAAYWGLPGEYFYFGNGAADVLFRLALALKPKTALLLAPTFADYEKALATVDCRLRFYELKERQGFLVQRDILSRITPAVKLVVICNPNNPTGCLMDKALLEAVLERCHLVGARLLVDECFMEFVDPAHAYSMMQLLGAYPELIILKAFTKSYAMPGIRLGYCLTSDTALQERLHKVGQDWNVSALAQAAGVAALREEEYLQRAQSIIAEGRRYLRKNFRELRVPVYGSEANYLFFYLPELPDLPELLLKHGYLIRSCANYRNLGPGYYRIAIKSMLDNRGLIRAIKEEKKHALITNIN